MFMLLEYENIFGGKVHHMVEMSSIKVPLTIVRMGYLRHQPTCLQRQASSALSNHNFTPNPPKAPHKYPTHPLSPAITNPPSSKLSTAPFSNGRVSHKFPSTYLPLQCPQTHSNRLLLPKNVKRPAYCA